MYDPVYTIGISIIHSCLGIQKLENCQASEFYTSFTHFHSTTVSVQTVDMQHHEASSIFNSWLKLLE